MRRRLLTAVAVLCALGALAGIALDPPAPAQQAEPDAGGERQGMPGTSGDPSPERGEALYLEGCSDCHGEDLRGLPGRGPTLRGAGAAAADFYLRTGRMPLADPEHQPRRAESPYTPDEIDALVAYIGSFGGPGIPAVHPERGSLARGFELYAEKCAGCHQIVGRGGIMPVGVAPDLEVAEPVDVAEALLVGPYVMPTFPDLTQEEIDSLARYVQYTADPEDRGGWGIGHIGPIPEGMVTWLLAAVALLIAIRLIGERTTP